MLVGLLFVLCLADFFVFRLFSVPVASSPSDSLFGLVFELVHQHRSLVLARLPLFEVVLEGVPVEVAGALQVDEFAAVLQVARLHQNVVASVVGHLEDVVLDRQSHGSIELLVRTLLEVS